MLLLHPSERKQPTRLFCSHDTHHYIIIKRLAEKYGGFFQNLLRIFLTYNSPQMLAKLLTLEGNTQHDIVVFYVIFSKRCSDKRSVSVNGINGSRTPPTSKPFNCNAVLTGVGLGAANISFMSGNNRRCKVAAR